MNATINGTIATSGTSNPLSGFIPVVPVPAPRHSSQRVSRSTAVPAPRRHSRRASRGTAVSVSRPTSCLVYYADLFGVLYGFYSLKDRKAFLGRWPEAMIPPNHRTSTRECLSAYRYAVVCRPGVDMEPILINWMFGPCNNALHRNLIY